MYNKKTYNRNKNKTKNKTKRNNNYTKKNKGGKIVKNKIPHDKSVKNIAIVMTPSALYGNAKILDYVFINREFPSYLDMVNTNVYDVEEFLYSIKKNKTPKTHKETIRIKPVYRDFLENKI